MRQIVLDTETTGLDWKSGDRVIEIGCVEMLNRRLSGRDLHFYLNPERANSEDAVRIHGLTDAFLADKPLFASIADELLAYLAGRRVRARHRRVEAHPQRVGLEGVRREPLGRRALEGEGAAAGELNRAERCLGAAAPVADAR